MRSIKARYYASYSPSQISEADRTQLHDVFGDGTAQEIFSLYTHLLKDPRGKPKDFRKVVSNVIPDKDQRSQAHQLIRRAFSSKLQSSTAEEHAGPADHNRITISAVPPQNKSRNNNRGQQNPSSSNSNNGRKGKAAWDDLGGEYLHFTLYKENKDTMEVVGFLGSRLKIQPKSFQFAGTKDRRAVTVQRVSLYRTQVERLAGIAHDLRNAKIGGFEYCKTGLELGELYGNEFVITLRECHFPGEEGLDSDARKHLAQRLVGESVANLSKKGFINYYGLQRFGTFAASTSDIGLKMLQGDLAGAIDLILSYSETAYVASQASDTDSTAARAVSSDDKNRALALHLWKVEGKMQQALEKLPRKFSAERNLISHLGATDKRTGSLVREKDYQGALMQIQRNLRLMYVHAYQSFVWNVCAGRRWESFGGRVVEGDLVLVSEHKDKEIDVVAQEDVDEAGEVIVRPAADDAAVEASDAFERARALTKEEVESGKYSIFDVVLPQPGFDVEYPSNEIGEYYKEFMGSERGGGLDPHDMRRKWKDVSLSGGYRKLLGRPGTGMSFEIKKYSKEDEQLVETDLERLMKQEKVAANGSTGAGPEDVEMEMGEQKEEKMAVVLRLQLGSSTYATVALRELMKAGGVKAYKPEYGNTR